MAVILKNINMPKSCADCPIYHSKGKNDPWNYYCAATMDDIDIEKWDKERHKNCPIKSVDDLIDKITIYRNRWASGIMEQEKGGTAALDVAINIIKEYCGIGE